MVQYSRLAAYLPSRASGLAVPVRSRRVSALVRSGAGSCLDSCHIAPGAWRTLELRTRRGSALEQSAAEPGATRWEPWRGGPWSYGLVAWRTLEGLGGGCWSVAEQHRAVADPGAIESGNLDEKRGVADPGASRTVAEQHRACPAGHGGAWSAPRRSRTLEQCGWGLWSIATSERLAAGLWLGRFGRGRPEAERELISGRPSLVARLGRPHRDAGLSHAAGALDALALGSFHADNGIVIV
jgi:hypothetical protein